MKKYWTTTSTANKFKWVSSTSYGKTVINYILKK